MIEAVRNNYRFTKPVNSNPILVNKEVPSVSTIASNPIRKTAVKNYAELIQDAVYIFNSRKDFAETMQILDKPVKLSPNSPRAYQLLGYLNLYGLNNLNEAERNWKLAISYGGSAVIRVTHGHSGVFINSCEGSLYIARDTVRFESNDN